MLLEDVLRKKEKEIINSTIINPVLFDSKEIGVLKSLNQLRAFKLTNNFPRDFIQSTSLQDCEERIKEGDNIYRTLEYCVLRNRVVAKECYKVFEGLSR